MKLILIFLVLFGILTAMAGCGLSPVVYNPLCLFNCTGVKTDNIAKPMTFTPVDPHMQERPQAILLPYQYPWSATTILGSK